MSDEDNPYVLATCPTCGVIHSDSSPHSYRYVDDVAFFDEHQLRDPLNMEPIFNPVCLAPPCRHTFSKETIDSAIRQHGCCPLDRTPQTLDSVIPAPFLVQNLLDKIRVLCPNNCSDDAISRCLLPRHLLSCRLSLLSCQRGIRKRLPGGTETVMERCHQHIRLCDAVAHSAVCEYRTFPCNKGCGLLISAKYMNSHICGDGRGPTSGQSQQRQLQQLQKKRPREAPSGPDASAPVAAAPLIHEKENVGSFQWKWGTIGKENGQFMSPSGIVFSKHNEILVADTKNHRIQTFNAKGQYLRQWGTFGSENGQMNHPHSIATSTLTGEIFICDTGNCRVQIFDKQGNFIRTWGGQGKNHGQFQSNYGIAISRRQEVYVSDYKENRIQVFSRHGEFIRQFGGTGVADGEFKSAHGIAISDNDEVYVVDMNNHRVQVFDEEGNFVRKFGVFGKGAGELDSPFCIAVHEVENKVYVTDNGNSRVQVFTTGGEFIRSIGKSGYGDGTFRSLNSIAVSQSGDVFVTDTITAHIQVFVG